MLMVNEWSFLGEEGTLSGVVVRRNKDGCAR